LLTVLLDQKLRTHTDSSIKRRDPTVQNLARKYNKLCGQLADLIQSGKAPRNAVAPLLIATKGLFHLDIDDEIWQDVGLDDEVGNQGPIPRWLGDENVRMGIRNLLDRDRCVEEETRLKHERQALQEWAEEEWHCIEVACQNEGE